MSNSKIILFFLISTFGLACILAQLPHDLDINRIIELSKIDRYEIATWAKKHGLYAQVVRKGEVEVRQWVPEDASELAEVEFGLSACAGIRSIRGGFGYFWSTCQAQFLDDFNREALALGINKKAKGHYCILT